MTVVIDILPVVRRALLEQFGLALDGLEEIQLRNALKAARADVTLVPGDRPSGEFLQAFINHLPISESSLFRHPPLWEWLDAEVLPKLVESVFIRARPLKFVSVGCSNGQEPFSLAMRTLEAFVARGVPVGAVPRYAKVLGLDPSSQRLAMARTGELNSWSVQRGRPEWARGWVTPSVGHPGQYSVDPLVRRVCSFEEGNLLELGGTDAERVRDADVVFCQNVLVYFKPEQAITALHGLASQLPEECLLIVAPVEAHCLLNHPRLEVLPYVGAAKVVAAKAKSATARRTGEHKPLFAPSPPARTKSGSFKVPTGEFAVPKASPAPAESRAQTVERLLKSAMEASGEQGLLDARAACYLEPDHLLARLALGKQLMRVDVSAGRRVLEELLASARRLSPQAEVPNAQGLSVEQVASAAHMLLQTRERA